MLFHTPEFLVFLLGLLAVLGITRQAAGRKVVLLLASYCFYMWWNPAFVLLILFSTCVDYAIGRRIAINHTADAPRRGWLVLSLVSNLGMLAYFKYAGLFSASCLYLLQAAGHEPSWVVIHVTLPVGISFYTFQTLSYTIDVYRGRIPATRSPLDFALFVAFFPQLVAGPIVRAADFLPQLKQQIQLRFDAASFWLIAKGLFKKAIVADNLAPFVDAVFQDPEAWPSAVIWMATLAFSAQIYCDFSGYTDIAIGLAGMLGFRLPKNFDHPYFAASPAGFWRRWHISLSTWLRDYLYIPLGGNRRGRWLSHRNVLLTMLLGGLWHGASWNFVLWGLLHGLLIIGHRLLVERLPALRVPRVLSVLLFQYLVLVTWICFRVTDFDKMGAALHKFVVFDFNLSVSSLGLGAMSVFSMLSTLGAFWVLHACSHRVGGIEHRLANARAPIACAASSNTVISSPAHSRTGVRSNTSPNK